MLRKARWVRARANNEDEPLFDTEDALVCALRRGPGIVITAGDYRLYLEGEETMELLADSINCAFADHAQALREEGATT